MYFYRDSLICACMFAHNVCQLTEDFYYTVKPVLSGHSKIDKTFLMKVESTVKYVVSSHSKRKPKIGFKADYRLMQVKSIAE